MLSHQVIGRQRTGVTKSILKMVDANRRTTGLRAASVSVSVLVTVIVSPYKMFAHERH